VRAGDRGLELVFDDTGGLRIKVVTPGNLPDYAKISISCLRKYPAIEEYKDTLYVVASAELPVTGGTARLTASPGPCQVRAVMARLRKWQYVRDFEIESGNERDVEVVVPAIRFGTVTGAVVFPKTGRPHPTHAWFSHSLGSIFARIKADGSFSSPPVPVGKTTVRVDIQRVETLVKAGVVADVGRIALKAYGTIDGTVKYPDGTPALGVTVGSAQGQMVGPRGDFRHERPPGKTSVLVYYDVNNGGSTCVIRDVTVPAGGTAYADFVVPRKGGTRVSGRLSGFKNPSPALVVYRGNGERWVQQCWLHWNGESFSFHQVPEGQAVIVLSAGSGKGTPYFGYRSVKIKNEPVELNIDGSDIGTIEGMVVDHLGASRGSVWVRLTPRVFVDRPLSYQRSVPSSDVPHSGCTGRSTESGKDGAFRFANIGPGEYKVTANFPGHEQISTSVKVPGKGPVIKIRLASPAPKPTDTTSR
jgi:hypothetical protein